MSSGKIATVLGVLGTLLTVFVFLTGKQSVGELFGPPEVLEFRVEPPQPLPGEQATLHWRVRDAIRVTIQPDLGEVPPSGFRPILATKPMTYILVAENQRGSTSKPLPVRLADPPAPVAQIVAAPNPQLRGEKVTLTWTTRDADNAVIEGLGKVELQGSRDVIASEPTTYEIRVSNRWRDGEPQRVSIDVQEWQKPELRIRAEPNPVVRGRETTVFWESRFAKSVDIEQLGPVPLSGSAPLRIDTSTTIRATAQGPGGVEVAERFVETVPPPPPTLAIYPVDISSTVQNMQLVRGLSDDILHRLLGPRFRLIEVPSRTSALGGGRQESVTPDYSTVLYVRSETSRGGVFTDESVQVTVRLAILSTGDRSTAWEGTAVARKSRRDVGKWIGIVAPQFRTSGFASEAQRLEIQALAEALEKLISGIPEIGAR